jgi:excisionase family DNA binding protein
MQTKAKEKRTTAAATARPAEVLDVHGAAALLTVSPDTVYDLFQKGELPGRKVGRKWITTKAAVLRWIENTSADGRHFRGRAHRGRPICGDTGRHWLLHELDARRTGGRPDYLRPQ